MNYIATQNSSDTIYFKYWCSRWIRALINVLRLDLVTSKVKRKIKFRGILLHLPLNIRLLFNNPLSYLHDDTEGQMKMQKVKKVLLTTPAGCKVQAAGKNQTISYSETEVIFVLAVNRLCKVLITGLRKTVLLIQNIQDTHQLCLNQICKAIKSQREVWYWQKLFMGMNSSWIVN